MPLTGKGTGGDAAQASADAAVVEEIERVLGLVEQLEEQGAESLSLQELTQVRDLDKSTSEQLKQIADSSRQQYYRTFINRKKNDVKLHHSSIVDCIRLAETSIEEMQRIVKKLVTGGAEGLSLRNLKLIRDLDTFKRMQLKQISEPSLQKSCSLAIDTAKADVAPKLSKILECITLAERNQAAMLKARQEQAQTKKAAAEQVSESAAQPAETLEPAKFVPATPAPSIAAAATVAAVQVPEAAAAGDVKEVKDELEGMKEEAIALLQSFRDKGLERGYLGCLLQDVRNFLKIKDVLFYRRHIPGERDAIREFTTTGMDFIIKKKNKTLAEEFLDLIRTRGQYWLTECLKAYPTTIDDQGNVQQHCHDLERMRDEASRLVNLFLATVPEDDYLQAVIDEISRFFAHKKDLGFIRQKGESLPEMTRRGMICIVNRRSARVARDFLGLLRGILENSQVNQHRQMGHNNQQGLLGSYPPQPPFLAAAAAAAPVLYYLPPGFPPQFPVHPAYPLPLVPVVGVEQQQVFLEYQGYQGDPREQEGTPCQCEECREYQECEGCEECQEYYQELYPPVDLQNQAERYLSPETKEGIEQAYLKLQQSRLVVGPLHVNPQSQVGLTLEQRIRIAAAYAPLRGPLSAAAVPAVAAPTGLRAVTVLQAPAPAARSSTASAGSAVVPTAAAAAAASADATTVSFDTSVYEELERLLIKLDESWLSEEKKFPSPEVQEALCNELKAIFQRIQLKFSESGDVDRLRGYIRQAIKNGYQKKLDEKERAKFLKHIQEGLNIILNDDRFKIVSTLGSTAVIQNTLGSAATSAVSASPAAPAPAAPNQGGKIRAAESRGNDTSTRRQQFGRQ